MQNKFTEVANKITTIKTGFAEAISAKGVETAPNASFSTMIANVGNITGGGAEDTDSETEWVKPNGWPDIEQDPLAAGEIRLLCSDYMTNSQVILDLNGGLGADIDWGDGTTEKYSGIIGHTFNSEKGIETSYGYKVYVVTIKPPRNDITRFKFYRIGFATPLLWFYGDTESWTEYNNPFSDLDSGTLIRRARFTNTLNITHSYGFSSLFRSASQLESVVGLDVSKATITSYLFHSCTGLKNVKCNLDKVPSENAINNCRRLTSIEGLMVKSSMVFSKLYSLSDLGKITLMPKTYLSVTYTPIRKLEIAYDPNDVPVFTSTIVLKLNYTQLDKAALDKLMTQLPDGNGKTLDIQYNPGSTTCDTSIATAKNWTVLV